MVQTRSQAKGPGGQPILCYDMATGSHINVSLSGSSLAINPVPPISTRNDKTGHTTGRSRRIIIQVPPRLRTADHPHNGGRAEGVSPSLSLIESLTSSSQEDLACDSCDKASRDYAAETNAKDQDQDSENRDEDGTSQLGEPSRKHGGRAEGCASSLAARKRYDSNDEDDSAQSPVQTSQRKKRRTHSPGPKNAGESIAETTQLCRLIANAGLSQLLRLESMDSHQKDLKPSGFEASAQETFPQYPEFSFKHTHGFDIRMDYMGALLKDSLWRHLKRL